MIKKIRNLLPVALAWLSLTGFCNEIHHATCEQLKNPIGITDPHPRFSWQVESSRKGYMQQAYQIVVSQSMNGLKNGKKAIWDSGRVESGESVLIPYDGPALSPATTYYWTVKTWSTTGETSKWSKPQSFTTGLPEETDWHDAKWIALEQDRRTVVPGVHGAGAAQHLLGKEKAGDYAQPQFRKIYTAVEKIRHATAFVCGLGHFDFFLNGKKVGNHFLDAGWTLYNREALYVGFDVTDCLKKGENVIGIMLGNGFYNVPYDLGRYFKLLTSFGAPKLRFLLRVEYASGQTEYVVSDPTWKVTASPFTFSSIYGGEDYDAQREAKGWKEAGYDDSSWQKVQLVSYDAALKPQLCEPVTIRKEIPTLHRFKNAKGDWVYDLGQNFSGIIRVKLHTKSRHQVIFRPAELLNPDSTVNQSASGSPYYFTYTTSGEPGTIVWQPQFTYYGFRYVQVEGAVPAGEDTDDGRPEIEDITGLHLCNAAPEAGSFQCSDTLFNQIHDLIDWAIRSNMVSVLTDCPHREKLGWLEQAHLMQPSVQYRYDVSSLYSKVFNDMATSQRNDGCIPSITPEYVRFEGGFEDSPEWGSSFIISAWQHYITYGDKGPIIRYYDEMKRYADYLFSRANNGIVDYGLGDWFDIGPGSPGRAQLTSTALTATAYLFMDLRMMKQIAHLTGHSNDEARFALQAATIKDAFHRRFIDPQTGLIEKGSQTASALPIFAGLLDESGEKAALEQLVADIRSHNNALTAGDIGYRYVLATLANHGRSDVIFDMNSRTDVPGYGWQLAHGATALTESWQAYGFVSNNHFMLGHLMEWLYAWLGGIRQTPVSTGYRELLIDPHPVGNVHQAETSYETPYGRVSCHWEKKGETMHMKLAIPENSTALVHVSTNDSNKIRIDNSPLPTNIPLINEEGKTYIRLGSGEYLLDF